jgi:hypothetical protein
MVFSNYSIENTPCLLPVFSLSPPYLRPIKSALEGIVGRQYYQEYVSFQPASHIYVPSFRNKIIKGYFLSI